MAKYQNKGSNMNDLYLVWNNWTKTRILSYFNFDKSNNIFLKRYI